MKKSIVLSVLCIMLATYTFAAEENVLKTTRYHHNTDINKMDDSEILVLMLEANEDIITTFGMRRKPAIVVRCANKKTISYIFMGTYIGHEATQINVRMDKEKAVKLQCPISTDGKALFIQNPIVFLKTLEKKETLLVGVTPYNSTPLIVEFDVRGIGEELAAIKKSCAWK